MNSEGKHSCWYTRLQGILYLLAFLTWGLGDAITSLRMIEQCGVMCEGNPIVQYIYLNYGASYFVEIKVWITIAILFVPFLIQLRSQEPVYWMINGYLVSFIIGGTLAIILNIQAARNEALFLSPEQVIFLYISLVLILTTVGEEIDKRTHYKIRSYLDCILHDISNVLTFMKK